MPAITRSIQFRLAIIIILILSVGTVGFYVIEEFSVFEAFYMTVITISTVGYQELHPLSVYGRILTIILIFSGVGVLAFIASNIANFIIETTIFRSTRMLKIIKNLKSHYIICGFGRMGQKISEDLLAQNKKFIIIESKPEVEPHLKALKYNYIIGDATDEKVLNDAGVQHARGIASVLGTDVQNVFLILSARELNPGCYIIAVASEEASEKKLLKAGANRAIFPYKIGGGRIAQILISPRVVDFLDSIAGRRGVDLSMEEVYLKDGSEIIGKKLRNTNIKSGYNLIVIAIYHQDGSIIYNPPPDEIIQSYDTLILVGNSSSIARFQENMHDISE